MISIHPEYADAIFRGDKKVEFRKSNIPRHIEHVVLYETSPERKITGYFSVKDIIEATPVDLWRRFSEVSGTTEEFFFKYYDLHNTGLGLLVDQVDILQNPMSLDQAAAGSKPPQSFTYVDSHLWKTLKKRKKMSSFVSQ